jgi:hypothetical protein
VPLGDLCERAIHDVNLRVGGLIVRVDLSCFASACPIQCWIVLSGTRFAAMRVPKVWRSSWKVICRTSARSVACLKRRMSFERLRGRPLSGCAKTILRSRVRSRAFLQTSDELRSIQRVSCLRVPEDEVAVRGIGVDPLSSTP